MAAITGLLKTIPLLSQLSDPQLETVEQLVTRLSFKADDVVVRANEAADGAYFVIDGAIDCLTANDGEVIATPVPAGSTLLELAMIIEMDASATCQARGPAKVLKLPRCDLLSAMETDTGLTDAMLHALTLRLNDMAATMRAAAEPFDEFKESA